MSEPKFYAHSLEGEPPTNWQGLDEHLLCVARLAALFAGAFHSESWGYCAGLWHDLGKYQTEFQQRLLGSQVSVEHSGAGAALAFKKSKELGMPLAFVIAGHHAGLANPVSDEPGSPAPLRERLKENALGLERILPLVPAGVVGSAVPPMPKFLQPSPSLRRHEMASLCRASEFWTRFLFSVLVDADRLDTKASCEPKKAALRSRFSSIATLRERLDSFIDQKMDSLFTIEETTLLNLSRAEILEPCRKAANQVSMKSGDKTWTMFCATKIAGRRRTKMASPASASATTA
jgi:CRISPR-associated endonuclease/helicase Cas3